MIESKVILIDMDGVLTDGKINIDHTGTKMFKSFCTRDVRSIRELVSMGYEVYIISADDWIGGKAFASKVGAEFVYMRDKKGFEKPYIAAGDDVWDYEMLLGAELRYCPADADIEIQNMDDMIILETEGGKGVIAELLTRIVEYETTNHNPIT